MVIRGGHMLHASLVNIDYFKFLQARKFNFKIKIYYYFEIYIDECIIKIVLAELCSNCSNLKGACITNLV